MQMGAMLFKAHILPFITYAHPVWCTVNKSALDKLDRIQRIALLKATGCLNSTASSDLDVIACCLPLQFILSETLASEYIRIMRKPDDAPIKTSMIAALDSTCYKSAPPKKLMRHAFAPTNKTMDIARLEHEVHRHFHVPQHCPN